METKHTKQKLSFCAHSSDLFQIQQYHSVTCEKSPPTKSVQHGSTADMILAFVPAVASQLCIWGGKLDVSACLE